MSRAPSWGCSSTAHHRLGWCGHCPEVDLVTEVLAWRLFANDIIGCDYEWARRLTSDREPRLLDAMRRGRSA